MRTIQLKPNGVGRYDDVSPFLVTDNKLQVTVWLPPVSGEFYLIAENNGATQKKLLSREGVIMLENLSAGELNSEVKHYLKGALIKVYKVEPLLLKEADGTLSAIPEIEALNRHISLIERNFEEYKYAAAEREQKLSERIKTLEINQEALIRFALEDFKNNVYLGGGTEEDFAKMFGLAMNKEHNKNSKGEEDSD